MRVSFGITGTMGDQFQRGMLRTKVANCQLVSVKRSDFCAIMHQVRIVCVGDVFV